MISILTHLVVYAGWEMIEAALRQGYGECVGRCNSSSKHSHYDFHPQASLERVFDRRFPVFLPRPTDTNAKGERVPIMMYY